jgi:predicted O-methyltransferase YrrM
MTTRETTPFLPLADDVAVRRSFSDWAHVLAFGAIGWPWLLRSLSGGSRAQKRELLRRLELPVDALPNLGSWKADTGFLTLIVDRVFAARPQTVVELGTGASTLVVGKALKLAGGGRLISCDQHAQFSQATHTWLNEHGIDADFRAAPLTTPPGGWPGMWYDPGALPDRIDLLVIDGPPWTIHPFVRGSAEALFDRISIGGTVMLDDAARPGERVVARKWRRKWPNFEFKLVNAGTKGTLIGTRLR